ncbi:hypothetical protein Lfu02_38440 [Longispora fulva]|uniref:Uncharacterized protein n=1 Tax=Longispora fulva TaxID=619741 RepID=A0A8J7GIQ6_9ACTN|nr:hypothetical protein [Longispora fulva]MBG6141378.1 hypothetical protein [Longispora fulva]GIG59472.1 hypothetical protein Lfu02_38440 [Longispora fulva]
MTSVHRRAADRTRHAARFVAWARAWRAGFVSYDEVGPAVTGGEEHMVIDLPGQTGLFQPTEVPLGTALVALSRLRADDLRLVLPAPGDPRGLPGPGAFSSAALGAGEGVIAGELGLVPATREHVSGSGDTWQTVRWQVLPVPSGARAEYIAPGEAELDLARELTGAADALTRLDVARWQPELAGALAALRKPGAGADLPPGFDPRSRRLYARAAMLDGVLVLADHNAPGGAVTAHEAHQRSEVLRPLRTACRRALMAACNAPLGA